MVSPPNTGWSSARGPHQPTPRRWAAEHLAVLYELTSRVARADRAEQVYEQALDALCSGVKCSRAAVLLFDSDGVMRFKAWRGLSEGYRRAVEGHSPWPMDADDARPMAVPLVEADKALRAYREVIQREGIRALAFIPLTTESRVIGKFMLYYNEPHPFSEEELQLAVTIGQHIAFAIERRRAQEGQARAERRFRTVADAAPALIWYDDAEGNCQFVNRYYLDFFGKRLEDVQERGWQPLIHPDDGPEYLEDFLEAVRERRAFRRRVRARRCDGRWRWVESHALPLFDESSDYLGHVGISVDISETVTADKRKDDFLATSAHELRNPLAAISSAVRVLGTDAAQEPQRQRALEVVSRQVAQLTRLVDDLLDVSRIAHGRLELRRRPVSFTGAVTEVVEAIRPLADAAGQQLAVTVSPEELYLDADRARLA